eukprot:3361274-Amphidinium_carterae.1
MAKPVLTISGPLPCQGLPVRCSATADLPPELTEAVRTRLQSPGVMKFAPPAYAHLGTFFRFVVAPVCHLLQISPQSLVRRNLEPELRVPYVPRLTLGAPMSLVMEVDQFMEFRHVLGHTRHLEYHYVALTIDNLVIAGKDRDTTRGMAIHAFFMQLATAINDRLLVGSVALAIAMMDAHHLVCICRAPTSVSMNVLAGQVCTILNSLFQEARSTPATRAQRITFAVDAGKSVFVQGGMPDAHLPTSTPDVCQEHVGSFPLLYSPPADSTDQVADCLNWTLRQSRHAQYSLPLSASAIRTIARLWLGMTVKQGILVAGVLITQLAGQWQLSIDATIQHICACDADDLLVIIFVYAASCALDVQLAVVDTRGSCLDGFVRTRGFGLVRSAFAWVVIAPIADSECIINELVPTISPTVEYVSQSFQLRATADGSTSGDENDEDFLLVSGGGAGSQRRKREREAAELHTAAGKAAGASASRARASLAVHWPEWRYAGVDDTRCLHVSTTAGPPYEILVPEQWTTVEVERVIAYHIAASPDWLEFTWVGTDVSVEYSHSFPRTSSPVGQELSRQFEQMPTSSRRRRNATAGKEVILGHRGSRGRGLTKYTQVNQEAVRALIAAINDMVPAVMFNAVAMVHHTSTPTHRDVMNHPHHDMIVIPQSDSTSAWMWIESSTGASALWFEEQQVYGSWIPLDRTLSFAASAAHQVHADHQCATLVLYTTARMPKRAHLQQLAALNFPLSFEELTSLADDPSAPDSESNGEALDSSRSSLLVEEVVEQAPDADDDALDINAVGPPPIGAAHRPQVAEVIQMLKATVAGSLRKINFRTVQGTTVAQAILVLKKLQVASRPHTNSKSYVLRPSDSAYLIRIKPSDGTSAPVGRAVASNSDSGRARATPIGARSTASPAQRGSSASSAGPQILRPVAEAAGDVRASNAFEMWVIRKLTAIELKQEEIFSTLQQLTSQTRSDVAVATGRIVHGGCCSLLRGRCVALLDLTTIHQLWPEMVAGAGRFQKVQLDTVARCAHATFLQDLKASQTTFLPARLIEHLLLNDKKCALAVFQAKSRAQRLRAVAAALRRIGMTDMATTLLELQHIPDTHRELSPPADERRAKPSVQQATTTGASLDPAESFLREQLTQQPQNVPVASPPLSIALLADRIAAIETWAHSLDCIDGASANLSGARVKEYLEQMVHHVCSARLDISHEVKQAQRAMQEKVDAQIDDLRQSLAVQQSAAVDSTREDALVALKLHLEQKLDDIEQRMSRSTGSGLDEVTFIPLGLAECVQQPADGRCLYHALAAGLADGTTASMLQAEAMQRMHTQKVSGVSLSEWKAWESSPSATVDGAPAPPAHWGGAVEIAAVASARRVRIRVFQQMNVDGVEGHQVVASFGSKGTEKSKRVDLLYSSGNHYDLLLVREEDTNSPRMSSVPDITSSNFSKLVRTVAGTTQKVVQLEQSLASLSSRLSTMTQHNVRNSAEQRTPMTDVTPHQHIMTLLEMHTQSIARTWQWVSANVRVTQQHASWLAKVTMSSATTSSCATAKTSVGPAHCTPVTGLGYDGADLAHQASGMVDATGNQVQVAPPPPPSPLGARAASTVQATTTQAHASEDVSAAVNVPSAMEQVETDTTPDALSVLPAQTQVAMEELGVIPLSSDSE